MKRLPLWILCSAGLLAASSSVGVAQQAPALAIGKNEAGTATNEKPAIYQFNATSAGVLTVVVQGTGDLALLVMDADGQPVPEGSSDRDLFNSTGTEQLMVTITEAGMYRVQVRQQDSSPAKFQIGASWVPFAGFARPADPDKRPATARALDIGKSHEDSLDSGAGDSWDWFVLTPKTAGTLTVILRPVANSEIDLQLEVYLGTELTEAAAKSDQDLQGNAANESATLDVTAGQKVYVKVMGAFSNVTGRYRLSSSLIQ